MNLALLQSPVFARAGKTDLLSWDSPRHALARRSPVSPLHRHANRASTPPHFCGSGSNCRFEPCSVRVVSHHLDGLLRSEGCRLVASCCRSWGSLCFAYSAATYITEVMDGSTRTFLDSVCRTPRRIPLTGSRIVSPRPLPPCRSSSASNPSPLGTVASSELRRVVSPSPSASRRCSAVESVASIRRCQRYDALSFLGFVPLQDPSDLGDSDSRHGPVQRGVPKLGIFTARTPLRTTSSARGWARPRAAEDNDVRKRTRYLEYHTANGGTERHRATEIAVTPRIGHLQAGGRSRLGRQSLQWLALNRVPRDLLNRED